MKRLRTIKEIIDCIKVEDPGSCVTTYMVKKIIEINSIKPIVVGNKHFYEYDLILRKLGLL